MHFHHGQLSTWHWLLSANHRLLKKWHIFPQRQGIQNQNPLCSCFNLGCEKHSPRFLKSSFTSNDLFTARNGDFSQASCRQLHFPRIQNFFFFKRQHRFSFIQHRSVSTFSWHGGLRFSSDSIRELNPECIKRVQSCFSSADGCRFCESQQRWYTRFNATALIFVKPSPVVSDSSCCNDFR